MTSIGVLMCGFFFGLLLLVLTESTDIGRRHRRKRGGEKRNVIELPPSLREKIKNNPLKEQPNLSTKTTSLIDDVIQGSRNARVVTKKSYLKREWCKTEPLKQVIREEGCLRSTIMNRFCYGQCNSFFIPRSNKNDTLDPEAAFTSCAFCKPKKYSYIIVTLRCPNSKPKYKRRRVKRVKQCKCMAQMLN
ncbi:gremlin-2-like [Tubulanus polymorphus]|uniref:gremlin-2-like n=1 Tax=Tubulanus polymorphus TaxID=672921 RepID=UPI003DA635F4